MKRRFAYYAIRDGNYKMHVSTWPMAWDIIEERRERGGCPSWQGCHNLADVRDFLENGGKYHRKAARESYEELMQRYLEVSEIKNHPGRASIERELVRRAAMKF